jgi:hypothetical protein
MSAKKSMLLRAALPLSVVAAAATGAVALSTGAHASTTVHASAAVASKLPPSASAAPSSHAAAPTASGSAPPSSHPSGRAAATKPAQRPPATSAGSPAAPVAVHTPPAPLAASQLPDTAAALWKPIATARTEAVSHPVGLNECVSVQGALEWQQQGYVSSFNTPGIQDSFTFADVADAQAAYQSVLNSMATCQAQSRALQAKADIPADAQVSRTASVAGGTAFLRKWNAVAGMSAPGEQSNHYYVVHDGTVLTVFQFVEMSQTPHPYNTADDQATLTTIASQLTAASADH